MNSTQLLDEIHSKIPLTHHMGLKVLSSSLDEISIHADFELNRNHKMTAFGGSVATVLTLACWSWVTNYLAETKNCGFEVSIHKCEIEYLKPITESFIAICKGVHEEELNSFKKTLLKKNKARLLLSSRINDPSGNKLAIFRGQFVAYKVL